METKYSATYWKEKLELISHVEGGSFREVYRSALTLPQNALTSEHKGERAAATGIYFLLEYGEFSAFHRIASDELWHFYDGASLCVYEITPSGALIRHVLGKDIDKGEQPQITIPAGSWFGSRVEEEGGYTLCGCTVSPGFDFADFELADRAILQKKFPIHVGVIGELT